MILSCNSCDKKFVVPDNAITRTGRLVQCSACGNKWKQFPVKINEKEVAISKPVAKKTVTKAKTVFLLSIISANDIGKFDGNFHMVAQALSRNLG